MPVSETVTCPEPCGLLTGSQSSPRGTPLSRSHSPRPTRRGQAEAGCREGRPGVEEVRAETALPAAAGSPAVGTLELQTGEAPGSPWGRPGRLPRQTYQVGGQSSAGTGCWQASGPHHLIPLHVGQWGAGGCRCGREGGQQAGGDLHLLPCGVTREHEHQGLGDGVPLPGVEPTRLT